MKPARVLFCSALGALWAAGAMADDARERDPEIRWVTDACAVQFTRVNALLNHIANAPAEAKRYGTTRKAVLARRDTFRQERQTYSAHLARSRGEGGRTGASYLSLLPSPSWSEEWPEARRLKLLDPDGLTPEQWADEVAARCLGGAR